MTEQPERHGIDRVFCDALDLALRSTRPDYAAEAASAAVRQYLASHDWIDMSSKGSPPQYKMVPKKTGAGDRM